VSGREDQVAANPDILTQASNVAARTDMPTDFTMSNSAPVSGAGQP